jgi:hypothetical protein
MRRTIGVWRTSQSTQPIPQSSKVCPLPVQTRFCSARKSATRDLRLRTSGAESESMEARTEQESVLVESSAQQCVPQAFWAAAKETSTTHLPGLWLAAFQIGGFPQDGHPQILSSAGSPFQNRSLQFADRILFLELTLGQIND